ncbi:MAG: hypothetical protein ABIH00_11565 [Armatimonadota bacterium]
MVKNSLKSKKGVILITVLILLVIVFILGGTLILYANRDLFTAMRTENSMNALYLAQAGLMYTSIELTNFRLDGSRPEHTTDPPKELSTGKFIVKAALNNNGTVSVESRGISGKAEKVIHAVFSSNKSGSSYDWYY